MKRVYKKVSEEKFKLVLGELLFSHSAIIKEDQGYHINFFLVEPYRYCKKIGYKKLGWSYNFPNSYYVLKDLLL